MKLVEEFCASGQQKTNKDFAHYKQETKNVLKDLKRGKGPGGDTITVGIIKSTGKRALKKIS